MPLFWGYKWQLGTPEKEPSNHISNTNALWGKNESDRSYFYVSSDSSHLRMILCNWGKVMRELLYWQFACLSTLQILCGEHLPVDFATVWWFLLLLWPHNATYSQNSLGESSWHIQFNQGAGHYICGLWSHNLSVPTLCICQSSVCADGW